MDELITESFELAAGEMIITYDKKLEILINILTMFLKDKVCLDGII